MRLTAIALMIPAVALSAHSAAHNEGISFAPSMDHFSVAVHSPRLRGLCFAPRSFVPNGNLALEGFGRGERVHVQRVAAARIEGLDHILSLPRVRITADFVTVEVPKENVVTRPFYLQLPIFDCRASETEPAPDKNLFVLSAVVTLPVAR